MIIRPANMKDCPVIYALYQSEKWFSFTSLLNLPSQKVMQKLGMEFVKEFDNEKVPADSPLYRHVFYRIKSFH